MAETLLDALSEQINQCEIKYIVHVILANKNPFIVLMTQIDFI